MLLHKETRPVDEYHFLKYFNCRPLHLPDPSPTTSTHHLYHHHHHPRKRLSPAEPQGGCTWLLTPAERDESAYGQLKSTMVLLPWTQVRITSFLTTTALIYATRAGITTAAGTRLALWLVLVNGFEVYLFQLRGFNRVPRYFSSLSPCAKSGWFVHLLPYVGGFFPRSKGLIYSVNHLGVRQMVAQKNTDFCIK